MLEALAQAERLGVKLFVEGEGLRRLNDDALSALFDQLRGSTEPYRAAVQRFAVAYSQQVEPLDTPDFGDPRTMGLSPASVETRAVWIIEGSKAPRLAVVKAVANPSLGNMGRKLIAWPKPAELPVDECDFVTWVDPRFTAVVAERARVQVPIENVKGAPRGGLQDGSS